MVNEIQKLVYVPSEGNPRTAIVAIVGEAPGETEEKTGRPFVGRSGQLVRKVVAESYLGTEDLLITNVVCVRPKNNRTPVPEEIESWLPHLRRELNGIRTIIALGRVAEKAVRAAGYAHILHSLYHPAYILRNPDMKLQWERELGNALLNARN